MRKLLAGAAVALIAIVIGGTNSAVSDAGAQGPPPIEVTPVTPRSIFKDDVSLQLRVKLDGRRTNVLNVADPSHIVVARITAQPGAQFPWHTHPGPVMVTVANGEVTYINANDCVERVYPAGTSFVDPGYGNVHTAFNSHDGVTELYAVFLDAPSTGPLTITENVTPGRCAVKAASHGSH